VRALGYNLPALSPLWITPWIIHFKQTIGGRYMMKRELVYGFLFILSVTVLFSGQSLGSEKAIELSFASFSIPFSATGRVSETWLKEIEQRTNGKVKFKRYWGGTLLTGKNMYEGIESGIADVGMDVFGYTPGRFPLWEGMDLPHGFPSAEVGNYVQWEAYKKFRPQELASSKVLFLFTCSPCSIWSKVPIRKLEDMKGLEIRATGFTAKMVKALGGTPVGAPQPEVYEMLAKGIIKGTWSSLDVLKSYKQADVTKYLTLNGLYSSSFYFVMNLKSWKSLPPDIQKIIDDYNEEYIGVAGKIWDGIHKEGLQYAIEKGMEIIKLPPDELLRWSKAVHPVVEEYLARMKSLGLPGKELMDEVARVKGKYVK
jgi:TRAP-type C4-dicarboxylate transport system substrate-binding protein